MKREETRSQPSRDADVTRGILRRAAQLATQFVILAAILFLFSGRLDWWFAWIYLAMFVLGVSVNAAVLMRISPELIAERAQVRTETKKWDKVLALTWGLVSGIGTLAVAGLDKRFAWSPQMPLAVRMIALLFHALGSAFASWALVSNAFFATTVHIQEDRGHAVASSGPYRFVRHPGYAGWILSGLATPVMLGSVWALAPALLAQTALTLRTALEDRTLCEELPGYVDYARSVRYRLLPGIW